jgi:hypothetical protein
MDRPLQEIIHQQCKGELKLGLMKHKLEILHHNVQSLINKHLELTVLLSTSLQNVEVLCFTEHWLSEHQINMLEINNNNNNNNNNNAGINYMLQFRFLGINITSNLKCSTHIQTLCLNFSKVCYIIKAPRNELSFGILRNIYFAKFQSLVRYGIILWGGEKESSKI